MESAWPLFDLSVVTPSLELRYATDELLLELTGVAGDVVQPGTLPFDGDATFYDQSIEGRRRWLRGQWSARAKCTPEWWVLVFAVIVDGHAVGTQEMTASNFGVLRTVDTFSWLTRSAQGRGIGKEMRAAALHLAFEGFGAARALSDAFEDNIPSGQVSRSLGYVEDGTTWAVRKGEAAPMQRFRMDRANWMPRRRADIEIAGLDACLRFLGLSGSKS